MIAVLVANRRELNRYLSLESPNLRFFTVADVLYGCHEKFGYVAVQATSNAEAHDDYQEAMTLLTNGALT